MTAPDYSNLTFSVNSMKRFLKDGNVTLNKNDLKKLNLIFNRYDKINKQGEKKPDGELSLNEDRASFMDDLEKQMPDLYDKLVEFFIVIDLVEEEKNGRKQFEETIETGRKKLDVKS